MNNTERNVLDPAFGFTQQEQGMNDNINVTTSDCEPDHNPYVPPPIKTLIMKKIKQNEYIEFEDLLPPPITTNTFTNQNENNLGIE